MAAAAPGLLLRCLLSAWPAAAFAAGVEACPDALCPVEAADVERLEAEEADLLRVQLLQLPGRAPQRQEPAGAELLAAGAKAGAGAELLAAGAKAGAGAELLAAGAKAAAPAARAQGRRKRRDGEAYGPGSLGFSHVPCNFGHTISRQGLAQPPFYPAILGSTYFGDNSPMALGLMEYAKGPGGELWGMMYPPNRAISSVTGCNTYYTPGKFWPKDLAQRYFGRRTIFGVLRNPYDKMANMFRQQVAGVDSLYSGQTRAQIAAREGRPELESPRYLQWYAACDVNAYLKEQLTLVKAGDLYRVNCQFVRQSEYFEQPHGITAPVDNRRLRSSFNWLMEEYGYHDIRMGEDLVHNQLCNHISGYSLSSEVRALIKEIYRSDFDLQCYYFGYCDPDEVTCMADVPDMCGGRP